MVLPKCVGGGSVYTLTALEAPAGAVVWYATDRNPAELPPPLGRASESDERVASGYKRITEDTVIDTVFDYSKARDQAPPADGAVRATLRLRLHGVAPEGERFHVEYEAQEPDGVRWSERLCGESPRCVGGREYSLAAPPLRPGTPVRYAFWRGNRDELVSSGELRLTSGQTIRAEYHYLTDEEQRRDRPGRAAFHLVLHGDVREGERFGVYYETVTQEYGRDDDPANERARLRYLPLSGTPETAPCRGGRVYIAET